MEIISSPPTNEPLVTEGSLLIGREDFALAALALTVSAGRINDLDDRLDLREKANLLVRKLRSDDPLIAVLPDCLAPPMADHAIEGIRALTERGTSSDPLVRKIARRAYRQLRNQTPTSSSSM